MAGHVGASGRTFWHHATLREEHDDAACEHESREEGMGPTLAVQGSTTKAILFEAYLESSRCWHPDASGRARRSARDGQPKRPYKSEEVGARAYRGARLCEVLFLAPYYSPEYNPIEEAFSKIKGLFCVRHRRAPQRS
jgi:hypothetical protein